MQKEENIFFKYHVILSDQKVQQSQDIVNENFSLQGVILPSLVFIGNVIVDI